MLIAFRAVLCCRDYFEIGFDVESANQISPERDDVIDVVVHPFFPGPRASFFINCCNRRVVGPGRGGS
jgi:hypothetical protein